jgi:hypothetical protein
MQQHYLPRQADTEYIQDLLMNQMFQNGVPERRDTIISTWQDDGRGILRYLAKAVPSQCWPLLSPK